MCAIFLALSAGLTAWSAMAILSRMRWLRTFLGSIIVGSLLLGCEGGTFKVVSGNHWLLQSANKQLSCYSGGSSYAGDCCWPYQEKLMICTYALFNGVGDEGGSIIIKYIWDKQKKKVVGTVK